MCARDFANWLSSEDFKLRDIIRRNPVFEIVDADVEKVLKRRLEQGYKNLNGMSFLDQRRVFDYKAKCMRLANGNYELMLDYYNNLPFNKVIEGLAFIMAYEYQEPTPDKE